MPVKAVLLGKGSKALITLVWFLSSVYSLMNAQVVVAHQGLAAVLTLVETVARVSPGVVHPRVLASEGLGAVLALVLPQPVLPLVIRETQLVVARFPTDVAHQCFGLVHGHLVAPQFQRGFKEAVAGWARELGARLLPVDMTHVFVVRPA